MSAQIYEQPFKDIESSLPEHEKAFLIGLHACGDLTNSMISWFCSSEKFKSLAVLSCCYHKMKDFPISMKYKKEIKAPLNNHFALRLGMILHKKSLITIFGHKHKIKNFIAKFDIFYGKISMAYGFLVHIWNQISNFEAKILPKMIDKF